MSLFHLAGRELFITASVGIKYSGDGDEQPEDLLRDADTAMYSAKTLGKAQYQVFDAKMHTRALTLLQIESDLRRAVEREEFHVNYQPIVSLENGRISGFEALVRWHHPERGVILPSEFVSVAEETGLIMQIDRLVLRQACLQMRKWQDALTSYEADENQRQPFLQTVHAADDRRTGDGNPAGDRS